MGILDLLRSGSDLSHGIKARNGAVRAYNRQLEQVIDGMTWAEYLRNASPIASARQKFIERVEQQRTGK